METIAKYELREVLGRGGMGVVYRAYDPLMDREVALKIIQERALDVPELKARFVREARMAGRLSHDNIAVVHDLGEAEGKTFIVMEYLPGRNLRSIIESREPLDLQEKLDYAAQICRGLHYAHANGIIHRDIKPENIQVLPNRRIKIMDFGIAKPQLQGSVPTGAFGELALTSAGMRIGTPSYMSPEQVKGHPIDRRSDIFALGVLLYEFFTYQKPFRGDDTTVLYKIVHEEPEPLQLDDTSLSELLQRVIGKCLAKEPGARYDDCLTLLRDLQEARPRAKSPRDDELQPDLDPPGPSVLKTFPGNFVGQTISHFRILAKIGDGGMGTVYKAEDLTLKRIVALKFLLSEGTLIPSTKERFLMEAQAASALDHSNICTIYEIGETGGGLFFICMSYCPGEDLGKILQKRSLDAQEALDICIKVARGLSKAHEHGIVHRDIKPANIIVGPSGDTKIVDFGLAKLSGGTQFTRMASVMGTLPYMSPEQIKGGNIDHRTDIWSLGVVLYQSLTGKLPFEGPYEAALFYAIVNETPVHPSVVRPALPPQLDAILGKALAKKADERYASMEIFLKEMHRVVDENAGEGQVEGIGSPEVTTLVENGKTFLERRRFSEALSRFEAALTLAPGHPEAESLRIRCVQELAQARETEGLVHEAEVLLERKKTREAREILLGVGARDPHNRRAMELLQHAQEILEREERLAKLLIDADFYVRRGKFAEARECYQKVLELQPDHREGLRGLKRTERKKEEATNRILRKTPLPAPQHNRRRLLLPAGVILLVLVAVLSWLLMRSGEGTTSSETTLHPVPPHVSPGPGEQTQTALDGKAKSGGNASPASVPASPSLDLKDKVKIARSEMLKEKSRADKAGSTTATSRLYLGATRQEHEGNRLANLKVKDAIEKAILSYEGARDSYRSAADGASAAAKNSLAAERREQPVVTTNKPPETRSGGQSPAKDTPTTRDANETQAGQQPASSPTIPIAPPLADTKNPPANEHTTDQASPGAMVSNDMIAEATARNEVNKLLQEYRESIEQGDIKRLGRLLNLSDQAQSNWSLFFSSSDNRKVSIEGVNMDITRDNARVTFKARMSFYNNQTNAPQNSENPRQWVVETDNGVWKIVTQK